LALGLDNYPKLIALADRVVVRAGLRLGRSPIYVRRSVPNQQIQWVACQKTFRGCFEPQRVFGALSKSRAAKLARATLRANRRRSAANVRPIIDEIMRAGATSHNAIAAKLNERNVRTARGGVWTHVQVGAILHPFEVDSAAVA
jgi:hypothetical protein